MLVQLRNSRLKHGVRHFFPVQERLVVAQGIHVKKGLARLFRQIEGFPEQGGPPLARNGADEIALESIPTDEAHTEALFRTPGGNLLFRLPYPYTPPGLLPGYQRLPGIRNHHLTGGLHPARLPQVRSHLDLVCHLLHRSGTADLPAEMRLCAVDAQRFNESLTPQVVNPETRLAGRQETARQRNLDESFHHLLSNSNVSSTSPVKMLCTVIRSLPSTTFPSITVGKPFLPSVVPPPTSCAQHRSGPGAA